MKCLVIEKNEKYVIGLNEHGEYEKIKYDNLCEIGDEIQYSGDMIYKGFDLYHFTYNSKLSSIAAIFIFFITISALTSLYFYPMCYANVDINPSFELSTNIFDRIVNVRPLNEDGEKIASEIKIKNQSLESGILDIVNKAKEYKYLSKSESNQILISYSGFDEKKLNEIDRNVKLVLGEYYSQESINIDVSYEVFTKKEFYEAKKKNVSPGKYKIIKQITEERGEKNNEDNVYELKNDTIKELRNLMKQNKKEEDKKEENRKEENKEEENKEEENKKEEDKKLINENKNQKSIKDESKEIKNLENIKEENKNKEIKEDKDINKEIKQDKDINKEIKEDKEIDKKGKDKLKNKEKDVKNQKTKDKGKKGEDM